jgi:hypothetical protein
VLSGGLLVKGQQNNDSKNATTSTGDVGNLERAELFCFCPLLNLFSLLNMETWNRNLFSLHSLFGGSHLRFHILTGVDNRTRI